MSTTESITRRGFLVLLGISPFAVSAIADALVGSAAPSPAAPTSSEILPSGLRISDFVVDAKRRVISAKYEVAVREKTVWALVEVPLNKRDTVTQYSLHRALSSARYHLERKARFAGASSELSKVIRAHVPDDRTSMAWQINQECYFALRRRAVRK